MDGTVFAAWTGIGLMFVTSVGSSAYAVLTSRNRQARANGVVQEKLSNLEKNDERTEGQLTDIAKAISTIETNCAKTTGTFAQQIIGLQKRANSEEKR